MNIKQANIILEKINRLYKSMTLDPSNIDEFEQELMLSYIRQLEAAFAPNEKKKKSPKAEMPSIIAIPKKEPKAKVEPESKPEPKIEPAPEPKAIKPDPKPTPPPIELEIETPITKPEPKPVPQTKPKPTPAPSFTSGLSKADFNELFDQQEAKELSEKLGEAPVKDLTKAMGLNEKIFTINELFAGDGKAFDTVLKTLNTFNSFDQAKAYLSENVAEQYDWTKKSKKKKAINLIKLIRRRYN